MALSSLKFLVASLAVVALVAACAEACTSSGSNVGLFTDKVAWGCPEPFDCFVDFCSCVDGILSTTCAPFNSSTSVATIEMCAARRVTCTLNMALRSRSVYNTSCQKWGAPLTEEYAKFYADRSNTNITDSCMADMCGVVTAGASSLADAVNYTYVCSLVNFSYPEPIPDGSYVGCVETDRTYFSKAPARECPTVAACVDTYCTCRGGTYNASTHDCTMPSAQPSSATMTTCAAAAIGCFTKAGLDLYVPGASPLSLDKCLAWSVGIAEDYKAYTTATTKQSTELWKACNVTACKEIYPFNTSTDFSGVCTFAAVAGRASTFVAYDPCPYTCPDGTCAASLEGCACTNNAVISNLQTEFVRAISSSNTFDVTKALVVTASAAYGISSGNCSDYDFTSALKFTWKLTTAAGADVSSVNSSSFTVAASSLTVNTMYNLNLTATGLKASQMSKMSWTFTAVAPTPTVSITEAGAALRIPNTRSVTIKAKVTDVTIGSFAWSCTAVSGTCPTLTNATVANLTIASGEAAGEYVIKYTYRGMYNSTVNLTIVAGEVPYVRVLVPTTGALSYTPVAYLYSQTILLGSVVTFSAGYTLAWTVNDNTTVMSTKGTFNLKASTLTTTTLTDIASSTYTKNTIRLKVTSNASSTVYGEASIEVVVVENLNVGLSIAKYGVDSRGFESLDVVTANALSDKLVFSPTVTGLTSSNSPFGAAIDYAITYYDNVSNRNVAVGLLTTPSGNNRIGTAPLFTGSGSTKSMTFSVIVRLNGLTAGTANASFTIVKPDIDGAARELLARVPSITDSASAVAAADSLRSLMKLSTNATLVKLMSSAVVSLISRSVSDAGSLSSDQMVGVLGTIGTALSSQSSTDKKALSQEMKAVVKSALQSANFDSANADVVLDTIGSMDSQTGGETSVLLAIALSNDKNSPIGESKTVSVSGFTVTAVRQTGAALAGFDVSDSTGASLQIPSTFSLPGISDDDVIGIASTVLTTNPYGTVTPTSSVVSYDLTKNGASLTVTGLSSQLVVVLPNGAGVCAFYSETLSAWSSTGVSTVVTATAVECHTSHLTAFGSFASSAATVAISALVVVLAAVVQLVLA